jgi:hypothetical protein
MRLKKAVFTGTVGLLAAAVPLVAHHSFAAEYDSSQVLTLKGTITQVDWTNPHIYLHIDVKDANGNVENWAVEGYPPNTLKRTGVPRDTLKIGDEVTIKAYKAKDGSKTGAGNEITFPDGTKKLMGAVVK